MTQHESTEVTFKKKMTNIALGVGLGLLVYISGSIAWFQYQDYVESAPATNWVEVTRFSVPDFDPGTNPTIDYQRVIKQSVSSAWTAELRHFLDGDDYEVVCLNSGFSELEPGRAPPPTGWTLGSFASRDCVDSLEPGVYRLYVTWELRPRGYDRTIRYPITSNTFQVGAVSDVPATR